jgi:hypothetical protein
VPISPGKLELIALLQTGDKDTQAIRLTQPQFRAPDCTGFLPDHLLAAKIRRNRAETRTFAELSSKSVISGLVSGGSRL